AIVHATGVYFPNRTHRARIALKKLRYASEIADDTGVMKDGHLGRDLRKAQDVLGQVHDRETLIRELDRLASKHHEVDEQQVRIVQHLAQAEIADLHARFLARRAGLVHGCRSLQRALQPSDARIGIAVAGTLALTGLAVLHRAHATSPH